MLEIPCKISVPINSDNLDGINRTTSAVLGRSNIESITKNVNYAGGQTNAAQPIPPPQNLRQQDSAAQAHAQALQQTAKMPVPALINPVKKGQKVSVSQQGLQVLDIRMGWNAGNPDCDIDVSAFMLDERDRVIGDDWFVFYGQADSPDRSVHFSQHSREDRQEMTVNLPKIDGRVKKIVFVLTIYEAAAKGLNFGMISDAYIRILDNGTKRETVSFKISEYYSNVLSMMIGEIYRYKGEWKFSAVGNGIGGGLEELCRLYGVELQ